jgi:predicted flap endonuclease-1-like 5' DNA nuclease
MTFVGGMLWWSVLGALVGWVAAWWLGRSTQRLLTQPVIQIVERVLDNPRHISRIASLEGELATLRDEASRVPALQARVDELLAAPPKVVEKVVTRTLDRVVEKPVDRIVEKVVEKVVERPMDRVIERVVPDLAAIAGRDAALAALRAQRQRVEHLDALAAVLADRVAAATRSDAVTAGAATAAAAVAAPSAAPAASPTVASTGDALRPMRARIEHLEALAAVQAERLAEERSRAPQPDLRSGSIGSGADIELVEGIGPKIAELLRARGLGSFGALAQASPGTLREILDDNGPAYRVADPSTWPEQARLAADGRWDELRSLQDSLNAGRR